MLETLLFPENFKGFYLIPGLSTEGMKKGNIVSLSAPKPSPLRRHLLGGPSNCSQKYAHIRHQKSLDKQGSTYNVPNPSKTREQTSDTQESTHSFTYSLSRQTSAEHLLCLLLLRMLLLQRWTRLGPWGQSRHSCHIFITRIMKRWRKKAGRRRREVFLFPLYRWQILGISR